MTYTPIVGTLGYVLTPDRSQTLLIHRNTRSEDQHLGKYNGLGGKLDPGEDVVTGMIREIREEAGITAEDLLLRGTINWTGFGLHGEDWLGFVFRIERFSGTVWERSAEGELGWHRIDALDTLPMWEGDRKFLPMVFDDDPRCFHGHMPYRDGRPQGWNFHRI